MHLPSIAQVIPVLQTAIGPMILISGIGLLLLSMTNRLGRTIDRSRLLARELADETGAKRDKVAAQIRVLWRRARLVRLAIALGSMSSLSAALLIIVLFFTALWQVETAWLVGTLFIACMLFLIGSLAVFIHDINLALAALKLELAPDPSLPTAD